MKYKLLALDIDGTLTNSCKKITEKTKKALIKLQKQGVKIVLASGRPTYGVLPLAEELDLKTYGGYVLSFNGAYILECGTNRIIYQDILPEEAPKLIYSLAQDNNCSVLTYENETVITETPEDQYVLEEARINKLKVKKIDSFVDYITFPIPKCLVVQEGNHLAKVERIMSDALGNRFNIFRSEPYFLEIMPKNIDKAYSLSILAKHLHISKEEVVACGDGYNDLTMIGYAGLGIAMKNAQEVVKHKADFVTLSNDEDGIAFAIEKMVAGTI